MQKYGTLNTMLDGKDQDHSDKVKPEKLELQGVTTEDSKVPNRMSEFYTTCIATQLLLLWCH